MVTRGRRSRPVALRADAEDRKLGNAALADLRRYYWCNVFLERYSISVETKARRDWVEMRAHWGGGPPPTVFSEAQARIGAEGYSIRESASHASSIYSGVFCLLALGGARDWALTEGIALQQLEDHHIVPQNYLGTHGFDRQKDKARINSIVNRTLIADQTNRRILDKAPATYLAEPAVFPHAPEDLLQHHFVNEHGVTEMRAATKALANETVADVYERFCRLRQATIVGRIRDVCGVAEPASSPGDHREEMPQ